MPLFTLHRNYVLRTTKGHTVSFEKDRAVHVAPIIVNEAVAIGAVPVEGQVDVLGEEEEVKVPLSAAEREEAIFKAFEEMKLRNERTDFTASGVPNAKRITAITGFEVPSKQRDEYWVKYKTGQQETKDQELLDLRIDESQAAEAEAQASAG